MRIPVHQHIKPLIVLRHPTRCPNRGWPSRFDLEKRPPEGTAATSPPAIRGVAQKFTSIRRHCCARPSATCHISIDSRLGTERISALQMACACAPMRDGEERRNRSWSKGGIAGVVSHHVSSPSCVLRPSSPSCVIAAFVAVTRRCVRLSWEYVRWSQRCRRPPQRVENNIICLRGLKPLSSVATAEFKC